MAKRKRTEDASATSTRKAHESADQRAKKVRKAVADGKPRADVSHGVTNFTVPLKAKSISCERRGHGEPPALIFTHGAGGGLSNQATSLFADGFSDILPLVSFEGNMNLQGRVNSFQAVIEHENAHSVALGGRSMGARAAVLAAQNSENSTKAVILASYPMFGAQKGDSREGILLDLPENVDVLFISGSNDSMCEMEHLRTVTQKMRANSWILEVKEADHGMSLKQKAGVEPIRKNMGRLAAQWLQDRDDSRRYSSLSWSKDRGDINFSGWQASSETKGIDAFLGSAGSKAKQ